jgi:hypothetical protein
MSDLPYRNADEAEGEPIQLGSFVRFCACAGGGRNAFFRTDETNTLFVYYYFQKNDEANLQSPA